MMSMRRNTCHYCHCISEVLCPRTKQIRLYDDADCLLGLLYLYHLSEKTIIFFIQHAAPGPTFVLIPDHVPIKIYFMTEVRVLK